MAGQGSLGGALGRAVVWLRPRAKAAALATSRTGLAAMRAVAHWTWRHRGASIPIMVRAAWWGALMLLVVAGRPIFDAFADPSAIERAPTFLWIGVATCVVLTFVVRESHMRWGSAALGLAHGALAWLMVVTQMA